MSAGYFQVVDGRHQIPVQAIVLVLASVGVLDDAENLALPVCVLHGHPDGGQPPVVLFLLFGERALPA